MNKLVAKLQNMWAHIAKIHNNITDKILTAIVKVNACVFILATAGFYCLGIVINYFIEFPKFIFFQSLFMGIFAIAFFSIRYFEKQMEEIHQMISGDITLFLIDDEIYRLRYSALNLIIPPIAGAFFGCLAAQLFNINIISLSSFYLIAIYTVCVLVSFLGYLQYIYLFAYIQKLGNTTEKISLYNKDYPTNTKWVVLLTKLYSKYRSIFFILGSAYVFGVIYFVLCDDYMVIEKIVSYNVYKILLVIFWGSVFLAIVFFFPISAIIEQQNIKRIVEKLKDQSIGYLNNMIPEKSINNAQKMQKSSLVIAIANTPDYPIKDSLAIAFSAFVSIINLTASVVAIIEFTVA